MQLRHVHHVAIIVSDYQASRRFYVELLGLPVIREQYRSDRQDWKLDLALDGMELEIFAKPSSPKRLSYPEACGLRHLAFRVDSVEAAAQELEGMGIVVQDIRTDEDTGKKMTFFYDPDGLPLELHE